MYYLSMYYVRFSLTYLPTQKLDILYGRSLTFLVPKRRAANLMDELYKLRKRGCVMIADLSSAVEDSNPGIPGLRGDFFISTLQPKLCIHSLAVLSKENAFKNISGLWSQRQSRYVVHCSRITISRWIF